MLARAHRPRSSAVPLAWAYVALVVYASLYPFTGWRWPPGQGVVDLAVLPWPRYFPRFDIFANIAGYLPLGALLCAARLRAGRRRLTALAFGALTPVILSFAMEFTQNFLPDRVPSRLDWVLNSGAGIAGALLAVALDASGRLQHWQTLRDRWFVPGGAGARALLLLWPVGLLFPTPLPLALGQVGDALRDAATAALADTPWADRFADWLANAPEPAGLSPLGEWLAILLGLLAPCLLAHTAVPPGWRRVAMALATLAVGFATTTLSAVLNFGPSHALAWLTPATLPGLAGGLVLAVATAWLGRRLAAGLALVATTALVALVAQAPADPYVTDSLQGWQQGRFIHFYGLAQWIGWLWPYMAILWLLMRLGEREPVAAPKA
jgi:VanZ family protein